MKLQRSVLVIDDDPIILNIVERTLRIDGHEVFLADSAETGLKSLEQKSIDLVVLDLMLPDIDGFEVAKRIRMKFDLPILMLTASGGLDDRIQGLDAGADDYLVKPFEALELNARVRSLLRRVDMGAEPEKDREYSAGDGWRFDRAAPALVAAAATRIELTERQAMILASLMSRAGSVVSRDELTRQTAGRGWQDGDRSLDVHVSHLRKKIAQIAPDKPQPIKTVRGRGFMFD